MWLARHKLLWTKDPEIAFSGVSTRHPGFIRFCSNNAAAWKFHINYFELGSIGLTYGDTGGWTHSYDGDEFVRIVMPLEGAFNVAIGGRVQELKGGAYFSPPSGYRAETKGGKSILLRLSRGRLSDSLNALDFGGEIDLQLWRIFDVPPFALQTFAKAVRFVLNLIDDGENILDNASFIRTYEEFLYLHAAQALVSANETTSSLLMPSAISRSLAYIEHHSSEEILIEQVALAAGVSIRKLQLLYKRHIGETTTSIIRKRRLKKVREMLIAAPREASITMIAFSCGFTHLGHFARAYREFYGETPTQTLNHTRTRK